MILRKLSSFKFKHGFHLSFITTFSQVAVCPGCGVHMQGLDPKLPGYFSNPRRRSQISNSIKRGNLDELNEPEQEKLGFPKGTAKFGSKPVVCARCNSLWYYGRVKDATVENLLPDFDFDHTIVVLMVVDAADFDGSFPRNNSVDWKQGKSGNVPRVVLVVTKIDLLPLCLSPTRLEHWVRTRAREGGANKFSSVHLNSRTYDGIDVTLSYYKTCFMGLQNSLIPQRSNHFEVSGFTVSKIVSQAERATNKQPQSKMQRK
ncbi:hypothetical protein MKX01_030266 [Papaver californicum]|nr:hypothetical protein MKX01_030266 [Papaver californicum]